MKLIRSVFEHRAGKCVAAVLLATLIFGAYYLRTNGHFSPESFMVFLREHHTLAPIIFIAVYSILPSLLVTTIPMTMGAGFLWGPVYGTLFSVSGATIGFSVSFLISRYIAGDYVKSKLDHSIWKWMLQNVDRNGWKVVAFTRVNPVFPATVVSYLFGLTSIRFFEYLWSTFVFFLPPTVAIASFGSSMGSFVLTGDMTGIVKGLVIASVVILAVLALKPIARKLAPVKESVEP